VKSIVRRVDKCRVCGSDDWLDVLDFGEMPLANGFLDPGSDDGEPRYPMEVIVCRQCWLMSLRHVIDAEALFSDYVYVTSDSDLITGHMRHIVDLCTERSRLREGDLVVELGSNIGTQLRLFGDRGARVVGVDPAQNLARIANERGITTIPAFFGAEAAASVARAHGEAKVVLGRQCFAHIDNVHDVLDGVTTVLAADGILAIEVPYLLDLLDANQFDTIFHEHLSYFSFGTLVRLFAMHGLHVIDVERAPVHGGSLVIVAARDAARIPSAAVTELLALEREQGITAEHRYREFAAATWRVVEAVRTMVRDLAADGRRVAGYGTPSKGCALLMACGLGPGEIAFCTDTTSYKHGKLTPGTHIPVQPPEFGRANPPDYFLLLAWNYAEEIIGKESGFLREGGRFIVPIPEPKVVSAQSLTASART
jgi:C-methyltransferase